MSKKLLALLFAPFIVLATQVNAATVSGSASIDDITVTTTGTASFSFTGFDFFAADSLVNDVTPFFSSDGYTDVVAGSASSALTLPGSTTSADAIASDLSSSSVFADGAGNAFASTVSELGYAVDGAGDVTVEIEVSLFAEILSAVGAEFVDIGASLSDAFGPIDSAGEFFDGGFGDVTFGDSAFLTFSFVVDGYAEDALFLETFALADTAVAPVPLPAAAWFLLSGVLGLIAVARRRAA